MRAGWAVLAATVLSLTLASGAHASKAVTVSCSQTITKDTKLASDLTDCPNNGIIIGADNITLDLNGHTIDSNGIPPEGCSEDETCGAGVVNGASEGDHAFVEPGHDGVTIKNGTIQEFGEAIFSYAASDNRLRDLTLSNNVNHGVTWPAMAHSRIADVTARGSLLGILVGGVRGGAHDVRVERNSVSDNEFLGILVTGGSDHVLVARNSVSNTPNGDGIQLGGGSNRNVVTGNSVSGSLAGVGLDGASDNLVTHNSLHDNVFVGVYLFAADDNRIEQNAIFGNSDGEEGGIHIVADGGETSDRNVVSRNALIAKEGDGILVDFGDSQTLIEGNVANNNTDDGIDVDNAATTLTRNSANRNHDLGIEAVPGVTDGGGNRASANGNPLQCTNVFCG